MGGKLCHDAIGFTIDDPGPGFRERTDLGGGGGHVRLWLWENDQTQERLDLMVLKGTGGTTVAREPATFRAVRESLAAGSCPR